MIYGAHVEWPPCRCCGHRGDRGTVRLIELQDRETGLPIPMPPLDEYGIPNANWVWCANMDFDGELLRIKAAQIAPPQAAMKVLAAKCREIGARRLTWERREKDGRIRVFGPINLYSHEQTTSRRLLSAQGAPDLLQSHQPATRASPVLSPRRFEGPLGPRKYLNLSGAANANFALAVQYRLEGIRARALQPSRPRNTTKT